MSKLKIVREALESNSNAVIVQIANDVVKGELLDSKYRIEMEDLMKYKPKSFLEKLGYNTKQKYRDKYKFFQPTLLE